MNLGWWFFLRDRYTSRARVRVITACTARRCLLWRRSIRAFGSTSCSWRFRPGRRQRWARVMLPSAVWRTAGIFSSAITDRFSIWSCRPFLQPRIRIIWCMNYAMPGFSFELYILSIKVDCLSLDCDIIEEVLVQLSFLRIFIFSFLDF